MCPEKQIIPGCKEYVLWVLSTLLSPLLLKKRNLILGDYRGRYQILNTVILKVRLIIKYSLFSVLFKSSSI